MSAIPKMFFVRHDGDVREVACCQCATCSNHFWIEHPETERPAFCPYCGIRFTHTDFLSSEDFKNALDGGH